MPVKARAWYVKGTEHAWPHGWRYEAGAFDTMGEAMAAAASLRPVLTDANLEAVEHVGRSLPVVQPRGSYDLRTVAGRRAAATDLVALGDRLGVRVSHEDWDGDPDVSFSVPGLYCNVWLAWTPEAPMPLISWVARDGRQLVPVLEGAWRDRHPHRKMTTDPRTWPELFEALEVGLCAGADGSAYA